jgi:hypothetical protein
VRTFARWLPLVIGLAFIAAGLNGCATVQADEKVVAADIEKGLVPVGVRGTVQDEPGLAAAVASVWTSYGRTDPPPKVLIVSGAELTCTDPNSGNLGFAVLLLSGPACREGYSLLPDRVSVAYRGQPWSQSALAHEAAHIVLIRSLQGKPLGDPNHDTSWFQLGGAVDQENAALAAKGL